MAVIQKEFNFMAFPQSFKRGNPIPLDKSSLFFSFDEMQNYARTDVTAYVGQVLACVDEENSSATAYIISNAAGDLKEVGAATLGDDKTIVLDEGTLALKNWGVEYYRWVDAVGEEGGEGYVAGHHEKQVVDETHPWIAGLEPKAVAGADGTFELAWYQPSTTTVEGLNSTVSTIRTAVDEINAVLGSADAEGTIRGDIKDLQDAVATKIDEAGGTMTGDLTLADGSKAASEAVVDTKIATAIGSAGHLKRAIVEALPDVAEADADTIYMVKDASVTTGDAYKEYMLIESTMAQIGDTTVDLTPYITNAVAEMKIKVVQDGLDEHVADTDIHITAEEREAWNGKVDAEEGKSLVADTLITKLSGLAEIKTVGTGLALSEEGVLTGAQEYTLPVATTNTLGGVKVGSGLAIDGEGVLTAKVTAANGLSVDASGNIVMGLATEDVAGAMSAAEKVKLTNLPEDAEKNIIVGVLVNGELITPNEARQIELPAATNEKLGVVKGSETINKIGVESDGSMKLNKVGVSTLANEEGVELIFDCGKADGSTSVGA